MSNKSTKKEEELQEIDKKILKLLSKRNKLLKDFKDTNFFSYNNNFIENIKNEMFLELEHEKIDEKIVYLGPEGSYTQEAAINKFGIGKTYYSVNSIKNIIIKNFI